ncbi:hypothetical protein GD416_05715 [Burkholderia sp. BE24]|uniref:hypothetical protein n=1 Tax=unclassified Burkholderia TaxID=2613784 RepID=UPI001180F1D7|nr:MULTISPECIES: hypothetical protein [unclassified Burkholderia]MPV55945.1 hypothetical protein [Burkholderia sp. BE24]
MVEATTQSNAERLVKRAPTGNPAPYQREDQSGERPHADLQRIQPFARAAQYESSSRRLEPESITIGEQNRCPPMKPISDAAPCRCDGRGHVACCVAT